MKLNNHRMLNVVVLSLGFTIIAVIAEPSKNMKTLLSLFNGFYTNKAQMISDDQNEKLDDEHDLIAIMWRPGYSSLFPDKEVIYMEQVMNKNIIRMKLLVLSEDKFGVITADPYNVIRPSDYKVFQYEYPDLSNITVDPRKPETICQAVFTRLEHNVYLGTYPDCDTDERWLNPRYGLTITCNMLSSTVCSQVSEETMGKLPYILYKKRSYTLPSTLIEGTADVCSYK